MAVKGAVACALVAAAQAIALNVDSVDELTMNRSDSKAKQGEYPSCHCLPWSHIYYDYKAFCGRGNELYFLSKHGYAAAYAATEPISGVPHKVCHDFFMNFAAPNCVNIDLYPFAAKKAVHDVDPFHGQEDRTGQQWCYVSNDCEDLNGGGFATNRAGFMHGAWSNLESTPQQAWKICRPGQANKESLADWSAPDVEAAGKASDVSMSRLFRLAYPAVEISWGEANYFMEEVNSNAAEGRSLADMVDMVPNVSSVWGDRIVNVHNQLRDIVKSGQGYVLDSVGHGENFHVLQGRAVRSVTRLPPPYGDMAYLGGHFYREYEVKCVMGCVDAGDADPPDLNTM